MIDRMPDAGERTLSSRRAISPRDIALLGYFAALAPLAWLLPEAWLRHVARVCAWAGGRLHPGRTHRNAESLEALIGPHVRVPGVTVRRAAAGVHLQNLLYLRAMRPGGWNPTTRVEGIEHIRKALAEGRGVIVWTGPLVFDSLMTKVALAGAGVAPGHLSHVFHNKSGTRFGIRVLNGFVTSVENRYLADRFVMRPGNKTEALRRLRRHLTSNNVASITGFGGSGARRHKVPLLSRTIELPAGAPELARRTGATLVSAFTLREPDGSFVTRIKPIAVSSREGDEASVAAFAYAIGTWVASRPDQCWPGLSRVD